MELETHNNNNNKNLNITSASLAENVNKLRNWDILALKRRAFDKNSCIMSFYYNRLACIFFCSFNRRKRLLHVTSTQWVEAFVF